MKVVVNQVQSDVDCRAISRPKSQSEQVTVLSWLTVRVTSCRGLEGDVAVNYECKYGNIPESGID